MCHSRYEGGRRLSTNRAGWLYIKGGAYDRALTEGVTYEWSSVPGRFTSPAIGFRCAMDPFEVK